MGEWRKIKLKEVLAEINERNKGEKVTTVLSVTNSQGFVSQEEYFEGTVHSENISNYKIVRKNQFAYNPSRVNVGSIDILKNYNEGALSPMYVIFEVDEGKLLPDYFKYYFQTHNFFENVKNSAQGSVRNSLSFKALTDFEYLLPPIEEQKLILKILNMFDSILKLIDEMIWNENNRKKYYMKLFLDKYINKGKKLKEFCVFFSGGTPSSKNRKYYDGNISFIRSAEINSSFSELTITEEGLKNSSAKMVNEGDLLMALYGANSGNVAISKISGAINQAILCIRSKNVNIEYLKYILEYDQKRIINLYLQGGQGNLSAEIVKNLNYDLPEEKIQNKIVETLKLIDKKIEKYQKISKYYRDLKKSLLQKLLTGKIRVKI